MRGPATGIKEIPPEILALEQNTPLVRQHLAKPGSECYEQPTVSVGDKQDQRG